MPFPPADRLDQLLAHFQGQRVLVVGDLMLDRYLWGDTTRISPEAPVPVIEAREESVRLGGAANVAHNVRALGAEPLLVGVTGTDSIGLELKAKLLECNIAADLLVADPGRRTTAKTRILARNQQVVRVDREDLGELEGTTLEQTLKGLFRALEQATVCIISDYGKGVVTRPLLEPLLEEARNRKIPVCVDPKETHFFAYRGVAVITPNQSEAGAAYGRRIRDLPTLLAAGRYLREELDCRAVLVTRGEQGMSLFLPQGPPRHFPAVAREVFDVTGAGDTVVSALGLALAAGATIEEAAAISNHAAGLVVREVGTAVPSLDALRSSLLGDEAGVLRDLDVDVDVDDSDFYPGPEGVAGSPRPGRADGELGLVP